MRKLFMALVASVAFAVAACGPGGGGDGTTGPTLDPGATDPTMTDPLGTPGTSPTDGMTMSPGTSPATSP